MQIFHNLNVDWMGKRKFFYVLSTVIFVLGLINIVFRGLVFGIDFRGGTELEIGFNKPVNISEARNVLNSIGLGALEVKTFGSETGILVRTDMQTIPADIFPKVQGNIEAAIKVIMPDSTFTASEKSENSIIYTFTSPDAANLAAEKLFVAGYQTGKVTEESDNTQVIIRVGIADWIKENLRKNFSGYSFEILRSEVVGPKIGNELKRDALIAIAVSLLGILIYLGFRFKFVFALGSVAALFHDVLITLGLFSLFYGLIPGLNLEISLTVVAAFLLLIGYSINDTVIVFDRVRENLKLHKTENLEKLLNDSINKTMSRTVLTGGTTLLTTIILMVFGGEVLRGFAFTMTFGIIVGTYSSIFVATALVLEYVKRYNKKISF
ncbi:MAG: hypothetical protein AMXMBFR48_08390 [Ignavibacteriales bacterium]